MIKTNYGKQYPIINGDRPTMIYESMKWVLDEGDKYSHLEGEKRMFERLKEKGYKTITFYRTTTNVRGYYHIIAYCKY